MTPFSIDTSFAESSSIFSFEGICLLRREADEGQEWPVSMTVRSHLFPFRTQKLSSLVPKIVRWKRRVKIGSRRLEQKVLRDSSQDFFVAQKYGADFGRNDNRTGLDKNTTMQYNIDKLLCIT